MSAPDHDDDTTSKRRTRFVESDFLDDETDETEETEEGNNEHLDPCPRCGKRGCLRRRCEGANL